MNNNIVNNDIFVSVEVEFLTIDGSNNNLTNPEYGSKGSSSLDKVPLYGDEISSPAEEDRANPRIVSNAVGEQTEDISSPKGLTNLIWAFGQFIDRDLDLFPESQVFNKIPVPQGYPYLDHSNTGFIVNNDIFVLGEVEFRTIDGSNNNLTNPEYGSKGSSLLDKVPLDYGDEISSPAGEDRTNPRIVSNAVGEQTEDSPSPKGLTNLIWAFGQFIDHDLDLVPESEVLNEIPVPRGDPHLDPGNTGSVVIPIHESQQIEGTGTSIDNPTQLANAITSWLDGSNIYGSDEERAEFLRMGQKGKLKVSSGNLLPFNDGTQANDNPRGSDPSSLFLGGDVRANENSVLASMHTLFVREHNRLADSLAQAHPTWNDEQLYQRAREINIAQYQNIIYNEYLPSLLGDNTISNYDGYDSSVDPHIARIFANAAFRFGHSQLSSEILRLDPEGKELPEGSLTLAEVFFQPVSVVQETGIDPIVRGIASSLSQDIDTKVIDDVRNLLFGGASGAIGRDLLAINIQRGRLNGVADYNTVRQAYGLSRVTSFSQITSNTELQSQLRSVYDNVNDIDAIIGLLAEDKSDGAAVGQTLGIILADQFTALRDGDRFYYENTFSNLEIAEIQQVTLSTIIRRNTDTTVIQDNAFSLINEGSRGNDILTGGLGSDTISGDNGNDQIFGKSGDDLLNGGNGKDLLYGDDGDDLLNGGNGKDLLYGGDGNDVLNGGKGKDLLYGGDGNDQFVIAKGTTSANQDIIRDYQDEIDKFDLTGGLTFGSLDIVDNNAGTAALIRYDSQILAIVENVSASELDSSDFI